MPTAQIPRGANLELFVKEQTDFKTAATGNYGTTAAYTWPLSEAQPDEDDPLLGTTKTNTRDQIEPAPGLSTMTGQPVVPLDFSLSGLWLKLLFGAPSTSGSGPNYTHAFASGGVVLPEITVERKLAKASGSIFIQQRGIMVDKATWNVSRGAGFARMSLDLMGYGEFNLGGSSGAGTPTALPTRDPIAAALGIYKIDGSQASILDLSLTYANGLASRDEPGDARVSGYDIGDGALTGTMRLRFRDMTLYDAAVAGTRHAGEVLFQKTADRSLKLAMASVKLARSGVSVEGPGFIDQTFNLRAEQTASAAMMVATLKSAIATL